MNTQNQRRAYLAYLVLEQAKMALEVDDRSHMASAKKTLLAICETLSKEEKGVLENKIEDLLVYGSKSPDDIVKLASYVLDSVINELTDEEQQNPGVLGSTWERLHEKMELTDWEDRGSTEELCNTILSWI